MPMGLRPIYAAFEPLPYTAALGQAFSFGWYKEVGNERGHAEVARHSPRPARPKKSSRRA